MVESSLELPSILLVGIVCALLGHWGEMIYLYSTLCTQSHHMETIKIVMIFRVGCGLQFS
jgi:hypothetical protein